MHSQIKVQRRQKYPHMKELRAPGEMHASDLARIIHLLFCLQYISYCDSTRSKNPYMDEYLNINASDVGSLACSR